MKKHRAQSDSALLEMLRSRGAVIGPTAGEALQAAVAKLKTSAALRCQDLQDRQTTQT